MWEKGQRTKQIFFWMTRDDVAIFSKLLNDSELGLIWMCNHSPDHVTSHDYPDLMTALDCSLGNQSGFTLSAGSLLPTKISSLGYLHFTFALPKAGVNIIDNYAPDYIYPAQATVVDHGSLGIRWNGQAGDSRLQDELQKQLKIIWKILNKITLPVKANTVAGHPVSGFRIGTDMRCMAVDNAWFLRSRGPYVLLER